MVWITRKCIVNFLCRIWWISKGRPPNISSLALFWLIPIIPQIIPWLSIIVLMYELFTYSLFSMCTTSLILLDTITDNIKCLAQCAATTRCGPFPVPTDHLKVRFLVFSSSIWLIHGPLNIVIRCKWHPVFEWWYNIRITKPESLLNKYWWQLTQVRSLLTFWMIYQQSFLWPAVKDVVW